jgi:hypothetical protein
MASKVLNPFVITTPNTIGMMEKPSSSNGKGGASKEDEEDSKESAWRLLQWHHKNHLKQHQKTSQRAKR